MARKRSLFFLIFFRGIFLLVGKILWKGSREPKVTELDLAEAVDEDICWLEISVDDICCLKEISSAEQIVKYCFDMLLAKTKIGTLFHELSQVGLVLL